MVRKSRVMVTLPQVRCKNGHTWIPRVVSPKECPVCGSREIYRA